MNKISKIFISVTAAMCFVLPLAACDHAETLESPTDFDMDDNYNLSWSRVDNARSYRLNITNVATGESNETTTRRENIALAYLETGDYDIRVRAIGDGERFYDSEWSSVVSLDRAYESGCRYQLINSGSEYEVTSVSATAMTELVMEDTYRGKPVTSIGKGAFRGARKLETLVLGKNVTTIGPGAFYSCSALKNITIPDTVTDIQEEAFRACSSLESFTVPAGVTELKNSTFAYCRGLKEIDFNNVTVIGDSVFDNCEGFSEFTIPDGVTSIGKNAFLSATELTEVTIGADVSVIGSGAFDKCSSLETVNFSESGNLKKISSKAFRNTALASVALPVGLESLSEQAFEGCKNLDSVSIPDSVTMVGTYAFHNTKIYNDAVASGEKIYYADKWVAGFIRDNSGDQPHFDLSNKDDPDAYITTYVFREDTVGIADRSFAGSNVEAVTLSENIKYVGASAFNVCPELYRFDASYSNIEVLDVGAFAYSENLNSVYLMPADRTKDPTLQVIGAYAFRGCKGLNFNSGATSNRFIPESVVQIGSYAFYESGIYENADEYGVVYADDWVVGCTGQYTLESFKVEVDGEEKVVYKWVAPEETHANIVFKQNENGETAVKGISDYAFYNCKAIVSFENAAGIRSVGRGAFYGCSSLSGYAMSTSNLRQIDDYAFYGCESLQISGLPRRLASIGKSAFYGCTMLDSIAMPDTLTSVGDFAFYGCKGLNKVTFGNGLTEIGEYAFYGCTELTELTIPANIKTIGDSAFRDCTGLETVVLEEGVESIGANAFRSDMALNAIELPASVKTVGDYAFMDCSGVTEVDLGRVEHIGAYAFAELSGVRNLYVPDSVKTIGRGAFYFLGSVADEDGKIHASAQSVVIGGNIDRIEAHAFYGCNAATFYVEDTNREADWGTGWNSSRRPTVWGVALSEDKRYVVSFTVGEGSFEYYDALNAPDGPYREGYTFAGWSLTENGTEIAYTAQNVTEAPLGTTLYAVYIQK